MVTTPTMVITFHVYLLTYQLPMLAVNLQDLCDCITKDREHGPSSDLIGCKHHPTKSVGCGDATANTTCTTDTSSHEPQAHPVSEQ